MDRRQVKLYYDRPPVDRVARKNELLKVFNYECKSAEERRAVLKQLLGACTDNISITPIFYCDYGCNIFIGDRFYSNFGLTILDCGKVTIGNNVLIAPNVGIYAVGHPVDPEARRQLLEYKAPVTIGNDVWIGGQSVINPGVTIGDGAVIGSGSVVTHDIEGGVVAAGNPCRVIRKIGERDKKYFFKDFEFPNKPARSVFDDYE